MVLISRFITLVLDLINADRIYIPNYFKSDFEKKVLISYITAPFINGISFGHSNNAECLEIAKLFHNKGYQVDIIRYNANFEEIRFRNSYYDVVFGVESNFLKAVAAFHPKKSIYYGTGAHYIFQNNAEKERLLDLEKRRGILLSPRRVVMPHESSSIADAVICFGNKWTMSTYENKCKSIECVQISAHSFFPVDEIMGEKNWNDAGKNFMCLVSAGSVHKGLDILLDIFKKQPSMHLYVCGNIKREKDFFDAYSKELLHTNNIHYMGWTSPDSREFKRIAIKCAFSILPSCSESMNGAIPTCMHLGLIPLVSKECGLDVEDCGIIFKNNSIKSIEEIILDVTQKDGLWLIQKSRESYEFAQKNNTIENFAISFNNALDKIL